MTELSVLIASHNRRERLRCCLDALALQGQDPATFEVIVAADGDSDGTIAMVEGLDAPYRLRALRRGKEGKPAALNAAIDAAEGDICLFLDDDIVAAPELVAEHLKAHQENAAALGIGSLTQRPPSGRDWYARAYATAWEERYGELAARGAEWTDVYGGNFSAPRKTLLEVGGFDAGLAAIEDIELGYRLSEAGAAPVYLPAAAGLHDDEKSRARLLADARGFGAFCAAFAERHPATRPKLLGWFLDPTPRDVTLRRLMLALRVPPAWLATVGAAIPGRGRRRLWFGFVSRYVFWRGVRGAMSRGRWRESTRGVPVLMYHAFTAEERGSLYVLPQRSFARQMRALALLRRRVVPFEEVAAALRDDRPLPRRAVAITIDDVYADNLELAWPVLRRRRFAATIFLVSGKIGGRNDWSRDDPVAGLPLLSAEEVRQLRDGGVGIGAHTRSHCSLPGVADQQVPAEIGGSREDLEALLDEPVTTFAYPYGRFDRRAVAAAAEADYDGACTVESRPARPGDDPLLIPRIEIKGTDSLRSFLRKLCFGGA